MSERDDLVCGILILAVVIVGASIGWYRASVQSEVYRREGIQMTTWEVFMGAKPAERSIRMKEDDE